MSVDNLQPGSTASLDSRAVRGLLRGADWASLGTRDADGTPFVSLVQIAATMSAEPVLLISALARHTRNLVADSRASLLVDQRGVSTPESSPARATLVGRMLPADGTDASRRHLARHAGARMLLDLGDFSFWRLDFGEAHLVAGFGRIRSLAGSDVRLTDSLAAAFEAAEPAMLDHLSRRVANLLSEAGRAPGAARITGVDPDGIDMFLGASMTRVPFDAVATDPDAALATAEEMLLATLLRCPLANG